MHRTPALLAPALAVLVLTVGLAVGCTQPSGSTGTAAPAAGPPKPQGELVVALAEFTRGEAWDPSQGILLSNLQGLLFESLYLHWPPEGESRTFLLESASMAPDALSWTFKLRDGIRFSNGEPMTADDVKFSLERYMSDASRTQAAGTFRKSVQKVEVLDKLSFRMLLKEPLLTLPSLFSGKRSAEGIVMPKRYVEQVGWDTFNQKPIGSGPYQLVEHKLGQSATFEPVPNHWRTTPMFEKVRALLVPEEQTRIAMLSTGQADLIRVGPGSVDQIKRSGFTPIQIAYGAAWRAYLYGALKGYPENPLQKLEVRKAITLAVGKKAMLDSLYDGRGEVAAYGHSAPGVSLGAPKGLAPPPYDPAQARQLLQQAGYPNGFPITIFAIQGGSGCDDQQMKNFSSALASDWQKIGLQPTIRPIDFAVFRPLYAGARHAPETIGNVSLFCNPGNAVALDDLAATYWSKGLVKTSDVADAEIERAQAAKSQEELVTWSEAAYRKLYENYSTLTFFHGSLVYAANKKLGDIPVTAGFDNLFMWFTYARP